MILFKKMCWDGKHLYTPGRYRKRKFEFYEREEIARDPSKGTTFAYSFVVDPNAPTVFIAPGGGYGMVCIHYEGVFIAEEFNRRGINAFVLYYRVGKNAHAPHPQEDMASLIRYVFSHKDKFGIAKEEYSVLGFSAGGHLAASFCTQNVGYKAFGLPKPKFAALCYAVVTLNENTHNGTMSNLTGGDQTLRDAYSAELHADDYPPTFLWCCEDDRCVPMINSVRLYEELTAKGIPAQLVTCKHGGHGAGLAYGKEPEGWFDKMVDFGRQFM